MEANLPIPEEHKNIGRSPATTIKVVNQLFAAGDAKAGVLTAAFNLPNDEKVRESKGSKKVLLKNVMLAKFEACSIPIAEAVLSDKDLKRVSFEAFFNHFLLHEISHSLGPGTIVKGDTKTTVNLELKDLYSCIEECKADILALYNIQFLIEMGVLPKSIEDTLYATYLCDMFRSIRFGILDAQGGGIAIQLNYFLERVAIAMDEEGFFFVNDERMKSEVKNLAQEILLIQAQGDYKKAEAFIAKYRHLNPKIQSALEKLKEIPVDIRPVYPVEKDLLQE